MFTQSLEIILIFENVSMEKFVVFIFSKYVLKWSKNNNFSHSYNTNFGKGWFNWTMDISGYQSKVGGFRYYSEPLLDRSKNNKI